MNRDSVGELDQDNASTADGEIAQSSDQEEISTHSPGQINGTSSTERHDVSVAHHELRWDRLARYYSDQYLDLFINDQSPEDTSESLGTTQFGSVIWTSLEKQRVFNAMARKGRHNLQNLANAVGTKSIAEIKDYLVRLREADDEHQMFAQHAKNVSLADMDAAVEVSQDVEDRLEQAADALAASQDKYDLAKARGSRNLWLIDTTTAQVFDEQNDLQEKEQEADPVEVRESGVSTGEALQMFHFATLLGLSRSIFMNPAVGSEHEHWTEYAEAGEEPSLTVEVAESFYNLVRSLVQRILQTSIFLAQSRIRSTTTPDYTPSNILKDVDVTSALDILNMPPDSWDYWTSLARRGGLSVVLGDHRKGQNEFLSLPQVEKTLSVRSSRGRRRSLSSIVSQSSQEREQDIDGEDKDEIDLENGESSTNEEPTAQLSANKRGRESSPESIADSGEDGTISEEQDYDDHDPNTSGHGSHVSRKRRRMMLEALQDEHLEKLDHVTQLKEEHQLLQILGSSINKEELEEGLPRRPRAPRKTKEDLHDWTDVAYIGWWERRRPVDQDGVSQSLDER